MRGRVHGFPSWEIAQKNRRTGVLFIACYCNPFSINGTMKGEKMYGSG